MPLLPFGAQEEFEDLLAKHLGHELGALQVAQRLIERGRQVPVAHRAALPAGQGEHVVACRLVELVALLDPLQASGEDGCVCQVWVAGRIQRAHLRPARLRFVQTVGGHAHHRGTVRNAPGRGGGRFGAELEALVRIHPLVSHRGDFAGVLDNAGDELAAGFGEADFVIRIVERVSVAFEQGEVRVHRRALEVRERLGHKCCVHAVDLRDGLDQVAEGQNVVCHGQRVGVAQVDLLLAWGSLVVGELGDNAHVLQRGYRHPAQTRCFVTFSLVEVAAFVRWCWWLVALAGFDHVELNLGAGQKLESHVAGVIHLAA